MRELRDLAHFKGSDVPRYGFHVYRQDGNFLSQPWPSCSHRSKPIQTTRFAWIGSFHRRLNKKPIDVRQSRPATRDGHNGGLPFKVRVVYTALEGISTRGVQSVGVPRVPGSHYGQRWRSSSWSWIALVIRRAPYQHMNAKLSLRFEVSKWFVQLEYSARGGVPRVSGVIVCRNGDFRYGAGSYCWVPY